MAKTVTIEIDAGAGRLGIGDGALFVGEKAPVEFTGHTPAEGGSIRLTVFAEDRRTPLADNSEEASTLDLRGKALRERFGKARAPRMFWAVANELDDEGNFLPEVLAAGMLQVKWSPEVFNAEEGTVATLKGDTGETGADGEDGQDGQDLTWDTMTAEQRSALVGMVAEILANDPTYAALLKGGPGTPGAPGIEGAPGKDGKDGADGADGQDGEDGEDGTDFAWGDMTEEQQTAMATKVAEALVNNPTWREAIRGPQGIQGIQGLQGIEGPQGRKGDKGDTPDISNKADLVDGKVPASQLPSYVDDVIEVASYSALPETGEEGKIYVTKDTNKSYRWSGTQYVEIASPVEIVAPSTSAADAGKAADAKATGDALAGKVDKQYGKQLSTEDYTTEEKQKLGGVEAGAQVNTIQTVKVNGTALTPDGNKAVDVTVPQASSTAPKMAGSANAGSSEYFSRGDHMHPTDTSRAPLASPTFTGTPKAPTPSYDDSTTKVATTAFVQRVKLYKLVEYWCGEYPVGNTVYGYVLASTTATLNMPNTFFNGRVMDFIIDVKNTTSSQATINFIGLGSYWYAVVNDGEDLTDMTTLAGGEIARFHFTQMAFNKDGKPVMLIEKQVVTEAQSGGGSYQIESDGTVTTEGELNGDGSFTVEGELNGDGTFTVEAL